MKKALALLVTLATLAMYMSVPLPVHASGNTVLISFAGVPSGVCSPIMLGLNLSNGDLYSCPTGGVWVKTGTAGGGVTSGTLTANKLPKANGAAAIVNSLCTDDGTTFTCTDTGGASFVTLALTGTAGQMTCPELAAAPSTPTAGVQYIYCLTSDHQVHTLNSSAVSSTLGTNALVTNVIGGSTVVGTGALATLYTFAIPAFTMKAGTGIQVDAWFRCSPCVGGATTWQWNYGATSIATAAGADAATTTTISHAGLRVFNNAGVTNAQTMVAENLFHGTAPVTPGAPATPAENTASGTVTVSLQFNAPATASMIPVMFTVQSIKN